MATNEVFREANKISMPVPNSTPSGGPVRVGVYATGLNGVAETSTGPAGEPNGGTATGYSGGNATGYASVWLTGAHRFPVSTTTTLAVGDPVYITSANVLTPVSTANQLYGHALTAKGATANALVVVRIYN